MTTQIDPDPILELLKPLFEEFGYNVYQRGYINGLKTAAIREDLEMEGPLGMPLEGLANKALDIVLSQKAPEPSYPALQELEGWRRIDAIFAEFELAEEDFEMPEKAELAFLIAETRRLQRIEQRLTTYTKAWEAPSRVSRVRVEVVRELHSVLGTAHKLDDRKKE